MEAKEFGEFIAANRKEKHITQAELAKRLNVTDKAVSRWERGLGFPDINTLEPLAEALDVTLTELMRCSKDVRGKDGESVSDDKGIIASIEIAKKQTKKLNQRMITGGVACAVGICAILCAVIFLVIPWVKENQNDNLHISDTQMSSSVTETKTEIIDGWVKQSLGTEETGFIYYPYVNNKEKGVAYIEEIVGGGSTQQNLIADNRPDGCVSDIRKRSSFFTANIGQAKLTDEPISIYGQSNKLRYIRQGELLDIIEHVRDTDADRYQILKQDVQAVSCALYEDFYDDMPDMTIDIYGIPQDLWNNTFGDEMILKSGQYDDFLTRCDNNDFQQLELLARRAVDKTDVYYVDYNDMRSKGDYAQIICVISFDKRADYTFYVDGNAMYEIYDEDVYSEWKSQNIDRFIQ